MIQPIKMVKLVTMIQPVLVEMVQVQMIQPVKMAQPVKMRNWIILSKPLIRQNSSTA